MGRLQPPDVEIERGLVTQDREQRYNIERSHFDTVAEVEQSEGPIYKTLSPVLIEKHIVSKLGDLQGKRVVECGCGTGQLLVSIAERGADTYGFDLSDGMVALARTTLVSRGVGDRVSLAAMTLEHTTYESDSFDLVVGVAVLHHTDLSESREEVRRILKPGGRGLFFEPMRGNPIIALFRVLTPKMRTPTEVPFSVRDIAFFAEPFSRRQSQEIYLTGLFSLAVLAVTRSRTLFDLANRITEPVDKALLSRMPFLRRLFGFTVLEVFK
jgi:ubiquinone/menaquinone biosynthesis C-methylase UbiE